MLCLPGIVYIYNIMLVFGIYFTTTKSFYGPYLCLFESFLPSYLSSVISVLFKKAQPGFYLLGELILLFILIFYLFQWPISTRRILNTPVTITAAVMVVVMVVVVIMKYAQCHTVLELFKNS